MSESERGQFQVVDKRGQPKEEPPPPPGPEVASGTGPGKEAEGPSERAMEEVNFVTFLLSLYSSAMAAFGQISDPATGKVEEHTEAGKQMIDILSILMEKTKGNLSAEEGQLLDNMLYELRMIYLEKTRRIKL
jgi:hypothetical protein